MTDKDQRIRERAHALWEQEGRPHGRHDAHWDQARQEIEGNEAKPAAKRPAAPKAKKSATKAPASPPATKKPAAGKKTATAAPKAAKTTKPRTKKPEG
ncbi:DUF2934 domain-containing protein [Novosphingobium malaysiense]|uniref:DUF2934 domain-containing protein n=1 Tax=Novosphingobium malaysiense TaxID=1348853 RepID=A0A0B1ZNM1_9SPHN|nr:DUF2934 domain-containing protein [Novosphingobium malaysiense]KHK90893.1 hypothetical protein LK12_08000 [Novosphingobium malaysiense]